MLNLNILPAFIYLEILFFKPYGELLVDIESFWLVV